MRLRSFVLFLLIVTLSLDAAPRRRAVGKTPPLDPATPAGWLAAHAHTLDTPNLVPSRSDLEPLRAMVGNAVFLGIGDGTHGTHEFYTVRLRVIDFAVREMDFDVLALEAPFILLNRIDAYVQGGAGDPRAMLREMRPLGYFFWDAEELVAVIEWMREYNAHRGERPAVHIAGFDVFEPFAASQAVTAYLRSVDPPAAVTAEQEYGCISPTTVVISGACEAAAASVYNALAAREAQLGATAAFHEALHAARVVVQNGSPVGERRDASMAENTMWLREHRSASGRMLLWAHNTHLAKAESEWAGEKPMGRLLATTFGSQYFVIATMTAAGTYRQWDARNGRHVLASFPPLAPDAIETSIRQRGLPYLLIPLHGELPSWLTATAPYNTAAGSGDPGLEASLPEHFDAVIFIDTTTPLEPLHD